MTSDGSGTSTSREPTPTPQLTSAVNEIQQDIGAEQPSQELDFYDARSALDARPSPFAPQISSALTNTGTESESMVGASAEDADRTSIYSQNPDELTPAYSSGFPSDSSRLQMGFPPQITTPSRQSTSRTSDDVPTSIDYPGRPGFRTPAHHYHPYAQRPGYIGQYALPIPHMGVPGPHPTPPQYTYHGYHPSVHIPTICLLMFAYCLQHHGQPYPYQSHTPENSPPARSPFSPTPIYAQQGMPSRASAGHGTPPFVGGAYTSLQYPSPEFSYRPPNFFPNSPVMYQTAQYGLPQYAQHFSSPPETDRRAEWRYAHAGSPVAPQQHHDAGRPPPPAFQRHHSYPYPSLGTSPTQLPPHTSHAQFSSTTRATPSMMEASSTRSPGTPGIGPDVNSGDEMLNPEKPLIRRSYHPKPPPQRSEWTMWAGNVPSDATDEEAWRFFEQLPSRRSNTSEPSPVVSVFLINRSNCAFVNYDAEAHLKEAIEHFSGRQLRPEDPRCLKLLCRVRRKDDDLKAGVGAQRGMGIHSNWIKEQKAKRDRGESSDRPLVRMMSSLSVSSSDEEHRRRSQLKSNSSSYSSTSSSDLALYFPKRYFILKSLTQHDLDLSLEKGLWATQKHNEGVLDKAYRTSEEVFLIFGVNKSGEFYGCARFGPIQSGEQQVAWEARKADLLSSQGTPVSHSSVSDESRSILAPEDSRVVVESPLPVSEDIGDVSIPPVEEEPDVMETEALHTQTAPAELGPQHQKFSVEVPKTHFTQQFIQSASRAEVVPEEDVKDEGEEIENTWGESFRVEWVCTERLPFYRIRHLRNPWNHDREVKVSRDGTELEPTVGQRLVEEWHKLATAVEPPLPASSKGKGRKNKPGS
ncbi:YT521-B-like domain-containing protein [Amanita rubescens]|nr:YT521-B-like domain-containing protein [Amanita rubescens]